MEELFGKGVPQVVKGHRWEKRKGGCRRSVAEKVVAAEIVWGDNIVEEQRERVVGQAMLADQWTGVQKSGLVKKKEFF